MKLPPRPQRSVVDLEKRLELSRGKWIRPLVRYCALLSDFANKINCPVGKALQAYQNFTSCIISSLENDEETAFNLIAHEFLPGLFIHPRALQSQPFLNFHDMCGWIKGAMLANPQSRSVDQQQFLAVCHVQQQYPELTLLRKVRLVLSNIRCWKNETYAMANLLRDPDQLYLFRERHCLTIAEIPPEQDCPICTEAYDAHDLRTPCKGRCKHVFCKDCAIKWLEQSKSNFRCPLCRACLVCGNDDCSFHVLNDVDLVPAVPLAYILDDVLSPSVDILHGFELWRYHHLRETTRKSRARVALLNRLLCQHGFHSDDPVVQGYLKEKRDELKLLHSIIKKQESLAVTDREYQELPLTAARTW
ncbi:hypothetical protein N0V90_009236 [Kalmusia sp. IMI 367209]|nr:hypothetical protein N0V90_009236 [Kalmusia sp. IMI 367209]